MTMRGKFLGRDGSDRDVGVYCVPGALHVGVPAGLAIVKDHVQPAPRQAPRPRVPSALPENLWQAYRAS